MLRVGRDVSSWGSDCRLSKRLHFKIRKPNARVLTDELHNSIPLPADTRPSTLRSFHRAAFALSAQPLNCRLELLQIHRFG
jgi:hypothetical protein